MLFKYFQYPKVRLIQELEDAETALIGKLSIPEGAIDTCGLVERPGSLRLLSIPEGAIDTPAILTQKKAFLRHRAIY